MPPRRRPPAGTSTAGTRSTPTGTRSARARTAGARTAGAAIPDAHVLSDLEALKAVADPLRLQLLMQLRQPQTVKNAAAALGVPTTRLYYHLRILEQHGLMKVVSRRTVSGIEEKTYQAVGESWTVSPELAASSLESSGVLAALLQMIHAELAVALRQRPAVPVGEAGSGVAILSVTPLALTPEGLDDFREKLFELVEEVTAPSLEAPEGAELYHLFMAGYPIAPPLSDAKGPAGS